MRPAAHIGLWATMVFSSMGLIAPAAAVPDLASRRTMAGQIVFADNRRPDLYYYAPLELRLVTLEDGRPDFSFIEMRYTGTGLSRDRGLILHKSILTLRVQLPTPSADTLARCARSLGRLGRVAELRPLPIRRLEAALVYVSVGSASDTASHGLSGGRFQGSRSSEGPADEGYWNERVFTLGVDSLTAQVLRSTLEKGQLSLSLGYAFVADGLVAPEPWGAIDASFSLPVGLEDELARAMASDPAQRDSSLRRVVVAGAIPIAVDAHRWPDLLKRIDVDADSQAGFAALDVYCYDFRDNRRPDLYEKQVDVEAETVGGAPVRLQIVFARSHPDVYSASLRFPVAVRLDRPYRYRVAELRPDGTASQGTWRAGRDWVGLLDLTTSALPATRGVRQIR